MKIAECYCEDCRLHFKIEFKRSLPPWSITCPICDMKVTKVNKIDGDWNETDVGYTNRL